MIKTCQIKLCGFTQHASLQFARSLGVIVGLVFYKRGGRAVSINQTTQLLAFTKPYCVSVGVVVELSLAEVCTIVGQAPIWLVQAHGGLHCLRCCTVMALMRTKLVLAFSVKTTRIIATIAESIHCLSSNPYFCGVLFDHYSLGFGGSGSSFEWAGMLCCSLDSFVVGGGIKPSNVIKLLQFGVTAIDLASSTERTSMFGLKSKNRMNALITAVHKFSTAY